MSTENRVPKSHCRASNTRHPTGHRRSSRRLSHPTPVGHSRTARQWVIDSPLAAPLSSRAALGGTAAVSFPTHYTSETSDTSVAFVLFIVESTEYPSTSPSSTPHPTSHRGPSRRRSHLNALATVELPVQVGQWSPLAVPLQVATLRLPGSCRAFFDPLHLQNLRYGSSTSSVAQKWARLLYKRAHNRVHTGARPAAHSRYHSELFPSAILPGARGPEGRCAPACALCLVLRVLLLLLLLLCC